MDAPGDGDPIPRLIETLARRRRMGEPFVATAVRLLMSAELDAATEASLTKVGYRVVAEGEELPGLDVPLTRARAALGLPYEYEAVADEREALGAYGFIAIAREELRDIDATN